ncbi:eukaryotic translation initiation factor 2-alpha kinase, partial [Linderina macrospora]
KTPPSPPFFVAQKNIQGGASSRVPVERPAGDKRPLLGKAPARVAFEEFVRPSASRYRTDFEEVEFLGKGGFGSVVKARNRIDGRYYAIKKIKLDARDTEGNKKIFREVTTLSRLHHQNVVRYYTTWVEDVLVEPGMPSMLAGLPEESDESGVDSFASINIPSSDSTWSTDEDESSSSSGSNSSNSSNSTASSSDGEEGLEVSGDADRAASTSGDLASRSEGDMTGGSRSAGNVFSAIRFGTMGSGDPGKKTRARKLPVREFKIEFTDSQQNTTATSNSEGEGGVEEESDGNIQFGYDDNNDSDDSDNSYLEDLMHNDGRRRRQQQKKNSSSKRTKASKRAGKSHMDQILYIQMEYCENKTLLDMIREGIDEKEGWRLFGQILEGLNHIHQSGVIHRDLKP